MPCICCGEIKKHYPLCFHCKLPEFISPSNRCDMCFASCLEGTCANCNASSLPWDNLRYLYHYDDIHYLLHRIKFTPSQRLASFIGNLMSENLLKYFKTSNFDLIVPAPITESSLHERQFNQSFLLAKPISEQFNIPLKVIFKKSGYTQSSLTERRRRDISKSISANYREEVIGKSILLIDDIITTGSTAASCALNLKNNGASRISIFTLSSATANEIFPYYLRSSFLKSNAVQVIS